MVQPTLLLNRLFRGFLLLTILINTLGVVMSVIYLESLHALPGGGTILDYVPLSVLALLILLQTAVTTLALWWRGKRNSELLRWQQLTARAGPAEVPPHIQRRVLNYAAESALLSLGLWSAAALILAIVVALATNSARLFFISFLGILGTSGLMTTAGLYFAIELIWRPAIPTFFPQSQVSHVPGVIRLSVLGRLVLGFFLTAIMPRIFLTGLAYRQAQQLLTATNPESALADWLNLELFFLVVTSAASIGLAIFVTRGIVWPLRQLQTGMGQVEQNDFTARTPVTTTDELGYLGERFNDMVAALERRNRELATVYQISQDIAANLELNQTLATILERVRQMIDYDAAEICLYDETAHLLRGRAYAGPNAIRLDEGGQFYPLGQGYPGRIAEKRESLLAADGPALEGVTAASFLGVPLLVGPKLVGTLALISSRPGALDDHDRQLLETIAPQAAVAIDHAAQVVEREKNLREEIRLLRIEIDETKRNQQVSEIVESDYFRHIQEEAKRMRQQAEG